MDMVGPRRQAGPAAASAPSPAAPRKEPPPVDLRNLEPIGSAAPAAKPAPAQAPESASAPAAAAAPAAEAPAAKPNYNDPLEHIEPIPAPANAQKPAKKRGGFWRAFGRILLVLIVLGFIATLGVYIYTTYNGNG